MAWPLVQELCLRLPLQNYGNLAKHIRDEKKYRYKKRISLITKISKSLQVFEIYTYISSLDLGPKIMNLSPIMMKKHDPCTVLFTSKRQDWILSDGLTGKVAGNGYNDQQMQADYQVRLILSMVSLKDDLNTTLNVKENSNLLHAWKGQKNALSSKLALCVRKGFWLTI